MTDDINAPFGTSTSSGGGVRGFFTSLSQRYQLLLDRLTPHTRLRWAIAIGLVLTFLLRMVIMQGWYIICYGLAIYHLNLFIAFLSPRIDPEFDVNRDEDGPALPTHSNEEFRPFIRRLPEFKFWLSVTQSTIIAVICTFFSVLNLPVFWPILVMYFITLFCLTMKRQIKHMIKYRYLPFTRNKPRYQRVGVIDNASAKSAANSK